MKAAWIVLRAIANEPYLWGPFVEVFEELSLTQRSNSTRQTRKSRPPVSIARLVDQLKLARSQCRYETSDMSTAAAIEFQIELRTAILHHLDRVRSELTCQFFGNGLCDQLSEMSRRKNGKGSSGRLMNRLNAGYRQCRIRS
jgi:hypothetical protein